MSQDNPTIIDGPIKVKNFWKIVLPVVVLASGAAGFISLKVTAPINAPKPSNEKIWNVHAQELSTRGVQPSIIEFGTIVAGNKADLRPLVSGRIVKVNEKYLKGGIVRAGEVLIVIDPFHYKVKVTEQLAALDEVLAKIKETEGEVRSEEKLAEISRSQLKLRKRDLERRKKLKVQGSSSRKSADDAEFAYNNASQLVASHQQAVNRLRSRLLQYKANEMSVRASLRLARRNLAETSLTAPFDGFLATVEASIGQYVNTGDRLASLIESERLEVHFRLAEPDFFNFFPNRSIINGNQSKEYQLIDKKIDITWRMGGKKLNFSAIVDRIGAEIDAAGGGVDVYAQIQNIDLNTVLRPGAFVEVRIPDRYYSDVILLPVTAVNENNSIYIIENQRLVEKGVDVIRRYNESVLLRGDFSEGDIAVSRIFPEISPGLKVKTHEKR